MNFSGSSKFIDLFPWFLLHPKYFFSNQKHLWLRCSQLADGNNYSLNQATLIKKIKLKNSISSKIIRHFSWNKQKKINNITESHYVIWICKFFLCKSKSKELSARASWTVNCRLHEENLKYSLEKFDLTTNNPWQRYFFAIISHLIEYIPKIIHPDYSHSHDDVDVQPKCLCQSQLVIEYQIKKNSLSIFQTLCIEPKSHQIQHKTIFIGIILQPNGCHKI